MQCKHQQREIADFNVLKKKLDEIFEKKTHSCEKPKKVLKKVRFSQEQPQKQYIFNSENESGVESKSQEKLQRQMQELQLQHINQRQHQQRQQLQSLHQLDLLHLESFPTKDERLKSQSVEVLQVHCACVRGKQRVSQSLEINMQIKLTKELKQRAVYSARSYATKESFAARKEEKRREARVDKKNNSRNKAKKRAGRKALGCE
uniref:Uncharacterized protein n=1 Tax=Trichogramma kaykai TaxID=54128 RepID=A0ABD2XB42_9HYME